MLPGRMLDKGEGGVKNSQGLDISHSGKCIFSKRVVQCLG